MITFPNCKINIGLNIIAKRADGFHNIETVFYPIAINDVLEVVQQQNETAGISFTTTGLLIEGDASNNLCIKAYNLLKRDYSNLPAVKMHLHKAIPMGAGLGGGSADGAYVLKLLNEKFQLNISNDQLIKYALQLGSDCPFFILNKPCFAESRGEKLHQLNLNLSDYRFVIINPGIHINTAHAFAAVTPKESRKSIKEIISQPIETWKNELVNDFEEGVFKMHPQIKAIKENLYANGAVYSSMTGSGSTVFGIFKLLENISGLQDPAHKIFVV